MEEIKHLNICIDKSALIEPGDEVYFEGNPPIYPEGVYILGPWDNYWGFSLYRSNDDANCRLQLITKGADSTRLNTFKIIKPT